MAKKALQKISLRIEKDTLNKIDSMVDHIRIKNRSQVIKHLVRKAIGKERIAVILSKGSDREWQDLAEQMKLESSEYNITAKLPNGKTLVEEQVKLLEMHGFTKIFIITIPRMIKEILGKRKDIVYIENSSSLRTMDALRLLKGKVDSDFLVFFGHNYPNMNLTDIFEQHTQNNNYVTLNLTWGGKDALSYVEVEGTKITLFEEKAVRRSHLTYNAVFVAHPKFLDEDEHSIVYDVFPKLAKKRLLNGFISRKRMTWLKKISDKEKVIEAIEEVKKQFQEE